MKTEKLTLLHLIPRIVPSSDGVVVGGSTNALLNLIQGSAEKCNSIVYTHTDADSIVGFNVTGFEKNIFYVEINKGRPSTILYGFRFLVRGLSAIFKNRAWKADIIHGHSGFVPYALLTVVSGKILRKPCLHTLYCPINTSSEYKYFAAIKLNLFKHLLLANNKILAMSNNIVNSLVQIGIPRSHIEVMPAFVDTEKYAPIKYSHEILSQAGVRNGEPLILFVGNLKHSKGLDLLIDALGSIVLKYQFRFIFTLELKGDDHERKFQVIMKKLKGYGLKQRTTILNIIDSMPELMASADLIVFPYRDTDGPSDYPIALLEAMASGIPAVATKVGGIPELIENGKTGLLVNPDNPKELASAIERMLADSEGRKQMGINSRKASLEKYPLNQGCIMINSIYAQLLHERSSRN